MLTLFLTAALAAAPQAKPATNTVCPVLNSKVDAKSAVVTVRGREYRICCGDCGPKLQADPDKYLEKDGTPRNAKAPAKSGHQGHGGHKG